MRLIQALYEQQVGQLLNDGEGVGDAFRLHGIPDMVDFRFELASDHYFLKSGCC